MSESQSGAVNRAQERRAALKVAKRHRTTRAFFMMTHEVWRTRQRVSLSARATKLLVDLCCQHNGHNNGDLTTAWSVMREQFSWRSKDQLGKATAELEARGWIIKTRQGMRARGVHSPTLWALSFMGIDDCGKHRRDAGIHPDTMPRHLWRQPEYAPKSETRRSVPMAGKKSPSPHYGKAFPVQREREGQKVWPFPPAFPVVRGENGGSSVVAFPVLRAPYKRYTNGDGADGRAVSALGSSC